ncbi:tRNA pseudouridine(38-40) synthase TruA [Candidatus Neptunochlamydia vexilliferae]|nr:tRNA pseudouridine(38-40) synthase TruA [Candidatus Neptunochlamydia vexilliferae]
MNIKLVIAYDGTDFFGWQESSDGPSIEGTLREVLEKIYQEPMTLQAASRTDAGVHAEGQVVNYRTEKKKELSRLKISLNQLLPKTIRVTSLEEVDDTFHPTLDNVGKEYHYHLSLGGVASPFHRHIAWHIHTPLDIARMKEAAPLFIGTHDFATFANACDPKPKKTIRTLTSLEIKEECPLLQIAVRGTNFLYKMVRNIVGTLVYIGQGKLSLEEARLLIEKKDRTLAGPAAPAHGLTLKKVFYP